MTIKHEEKDWIKCTLADACEEINYGLTASASDDPVGPKFLRITDSHVDGHGDSVPTSGGIPGPHADDIGVLGLKVERCALGDGDLAGGRIDVEELRISPNEAVGDSVPVRVGGSYPTSNARASRGVLGDGARGAGPLAEYRGTVGRRSATATTSSSARARPANPYACSAAHGVVVQLEVPQHAGEVIGTRCAGGRNGVGEGGVPLPARPSTTTTRLRLRPRPLSPATSARPT